MKTGISAKSSQKRKVSEKGKFSCKEMSEAHECEQLWCLNLVQQTVYRVFPRVSSVNTTGSYWEWRVRWFHLRINLRAQPSSPNRQSSSCPSGPRSQNKEQSTWDPNSWLRLHTNAPCKPGSKTRKQAGTQRLCFRSRSLYLSNRLFVIVF